MSERILVCGGREFGSPPPFEPDGMDYQALILKARKERELLKRVLDAAKAKYKIDCIIQGGARGADKLAFNWAYDNNLTVHNCPADWKTHGKKAGALRNQSMLDDYNPTLVIAFAGGTGTADMVRRSKAAGLKVIEVKL